MLYGFRLTFGDIADVGLNVVLTVIKEESHKVSVAIMKFPASNYQHSLKTDIIAQLFLRKTQ